MFKTKILFHVLLVLATLCSCKKHEESSLEIPFPEALNGALIAQKNHANPIENSVFLGNGDINGMVFSKGNDLVVHLSKNDVWDARLDTENDPPLMKIDVANQKYHGGAKEHDTPPSWKNPYPSPRICGRLIIKNLGSFHSELNIHHAKATIKQNNKDLTIRALAQQNVFLIDTNEKVELESIVVDHLPQAKKGNDNNVQWIFQELPGDKDWKGMSFAVALAQKNGKTVVAIVSSLESEQPKKEAIALAKDVLSTNTTELIANHETIWNQFWAKSGIDLEDKALTNIWYQNLYFMRCVSKPNVYPIGLYAGAANENALWHGSYTLDYNVEQAFWGPYSSNHGELSEPYTKLISDYMPRAKWFAKETYGLEGACFPVNIFAHEPNPADCKSINKRMMAYVPWSYALGVSGYVARNIWLRYKYYPNETYLEHVAYPILKEISLFYCNLIAQCKLDEHGKAILGPSYSPEHGDFGTFNSAFDIAFIRSTFKSTLEAIALLELDTDLEHRIKENVLLIPDLPISNGDTSVVVDWPGDDPERNHNIPTTVASVFPAEIYSWFSESDEKEILKNTVTNINCTGVNSTVTMAVAKARLSLEGTWEWMKSEFLSRRRRNGILTLMPGDHQFNSFGIYTETFSASGAISELLLQSVDDIIRVFPAWPLHKNGTFKNLRAQGGFLVSSKQSDSQIEHIEVVSTVWGKLQLLNPWGQTKIVCEYSGTSEIIDLEKDEIITIPTAPNYLYSFKPVYSPKTL
ncbi:glycosyl hydrolase family 95 catalytic domain-containing protein [Aestuariivivens marinum]|uniref:glycosyl hydrolase family 95 catalytic domain-containing protein n=1 Tax=Aestuariivivens marinum TaxID=2913555 RepID=UPI001F5A4D68|nr:hypothetical protein [Aestuariivivens marinum]